MPTLTIAKRELTSLFYSPIAYVVLGVFALVSTLLFLMSFIPGQAATLRDEFGWIVWLMAFIVPAISMRLVSEELRSGTIEPLMTSPISDAQVITGKWIGGLGFFLVMLSPLAVHLIVLEINADPDYGPIASGIVGLLFVGGLYMAIGVFVSSITQNQIIAFLITVLITGFLT
ncbi:MAG: ABC transporter permease, partial [Phycisphaeraceae bacterium]|nr:ABC transporter permease [Phycisphaeraceae bacterium]